MLNIHKRIRAVESESEKIRRKQKDVLYQKSARYAKKELTLQNFDGNKKSSVNPDPVTKASNKIASNDSPSHCMLDALHEQRKILIKQNGSKTCLDFESHFKTCLV